MAFRSDSTATYTYATNSTGGTVDLGARNNYRYVNADNVYNKGKADGVTVHSATYTFASGSTGSKVDLGASHSYRYVDATNVYAKGEADAGGDKTHTVKLVMTSSGPYDSGNANARYACSLKFYIDDAVKVSWGGNLRDDGSISGWTRTSSWTV